MNINEQIKQEFRRRNKNGQKELKKNSSLQIRKENLIRKKKILQYKRYYTMKILIKNRYSGINIYILLIVMFSYAIYSGYATSR